MEIIIVAVTMLVSSFWFVVGFNVGRGKNPIVNTNREARTSLDDS